MNTIEIFHFGFEAILAVMAIAAVMIARRPVKNQVSFDPSYATKQDLEKHESLDRSEHQTMRADIQALQISAGGTSANALMDKFRTVLDEKILTMQAADARWREGIDQRINEVSSKVDRLSGEFQQMAKKI